MLIGCDEQQPSSLQNWEAEFFMMDDTEALREGELSRPTAESGTAQDDLLLSVAVD